MQNRRTLILIIALLLWSRLAVAGTCCLWEVDDGRLYLLGSMHLMKAEHYPLKAPIERAFARADIVVFETDLDKLEAPRSQTLLMQQALLPAGKSLKGRLDPETYALLRRKAADLGVDIALYDRYAPWFVSTTLSALKMMQLGYAPDHGVDRHLYSRAKQEGKQVRGLETAAEQVALLTGLSTADDSLLLKQTIDEMDSLSSELDAITGAWLTGDTTTLDRLILKSFRAYPVVYERFITRRNRAWLQEIEPLTRHKKPVLVVVGTAHLVGEDGLVRLLSENGHRLVQQ